MLRSLQTGSHFPRNMYFKSTFTQRWAFSNRQHLATTKTLAGMLGEWTEQEQLLVMEQAALRDMPVVYFLRLDAHHSCACLVACNEEVEWKGG